MSALLLFGCLFWALFLTTQVSAVDLDFKGYFRSRSHMLYNLDLDRSAKPQLRNFNDMRFRLNPTFYVTDKVRIKTSLNFLDGPLGSNPNHRAPYGNPAQANDRLLDVNESETLQMGRGVAGSELVTDGGIYVPDGLVTTTDFSPIQLRRAWGEFDLPFGTLLVGRMPFHLGLGIYANQGDGADQEVGSTRDRLVFDTNFGVYYMRPGIGWLVEGALDQSSDDFMEYFFTFGRKTELQDISMHISLNKQGRYVAPSSVTTSSSLSGRGSTFWAFDFFAENKFSVVTLGAEVVLFHGTVSGRDLLAVNSALRSSFDWAPWTLLAEAGFSSGTSKSEVAANDLKTVSFSRDYNVALLLFEEALPGGKQLKNSSGTVHSQATAPHAGAVSNAFYPRFKATYDATSFFRPSVNLITAFAAERPIDGRGRFYGFEYDLLTDWTITNYLSAEASFGHFVPGSFYNHVSRAHSALILKAGLTATF